MLTCDQCHTARGTVLPIRPENYYFWQTFFAVPFAVLAWAAASGLIHGLGRQVQVRGPFKRNASRAGAAVAAALFMAWLPMALAALLLVFGMDQEEIVGLLSLPGPWQVFDLALYVLAAGAAVVLLTLAAGQGEFTKAGRVRAALVGTLTTAVLASLFAIFIR